MSGTNTFPVHLCRLHPTAHVLVFHLRKNVCYGSKTWAIDGTFSIVSFWVIYRKLANLLGAFAILLKAIISFMSVCPHTWNNSAPTERTFMKLDIDDDACKIY
jgi:hypothetical protein